MKRDSTPFCNARRFDFRAINRVNRSQAKDGIDPSGDFFLERFSVRVFVKNPE